MFSRGGEVGHPIKKRWSRSSFFFVRHISFKKKETTIEYEREEEKRREKEERRKTGVCVFVFNGAKSPFFV